MNWKIGNYYRAIVLEVDIVAIKIKSTKYINGISHIVIHRFKTIRICEWRIVLVAKN